MYGIYLLCCFFSVVFADDDFSKFEKEMQINPSVIGPASDEVTVYSKLRNKTVNKAVDTQFESIETRIIAEPERDEVFICLTKYS